MDPDVVRTILGEFHRQDDQDQTRIVSDPQRKTLLAMVSKAFPGERLGHQDRMAIWTALIGDDIPSTWLVGKRTANRIITMAYGRSADLATAPLKQEFVDLLNLVRSVSNG